MKNYLSLAKNIINFPEKNDPVSLQDIITDGNLHSLKAKDFELTSTPYLNNPLDNLNISHIFGQQQSDEIERVANCKDCSLFESLRNRGRLPNGARQTPSNYLEIITEHRDALNAMRNLGTPVFDTIRKYQKKLRIELTLQKVTKKMTQATINSALLAAQKSNCIILDMSRAKAKLIFSMEKAHFSKLEDELEVKLYLHPIFNNYANRLFNLRTCENCKETFFYTREEAKFCSERCQGIAGRRRRSNQ